MPMMDVFKSYLPRSTADLSFGGYDTGFFPRSPMETAKLMVGCWRYLHEIVPTIPAPMLQEQILQNLAQKNGDDLQSACLALVSKLCSLLTKKRESFRCQFTIGEETLTLKFPDVPEVEQRDAAQSGSVEKVDCASQTSEDSEEADCSPQDVGGLQGAQGHPAGFGFPTPPWGAYGPMWAPYMYTAPMIPMYMGGLGVNTQGCSCSCGKAAGVGTQKGCTK
ncbi:uncharacterized protein LOC132195265 [Neocloeon triangulifer]|uniref:uncharacterized protein LOC132195265 n=1 Tax=Neocloeon triangulifer TaxID=2078957 RepID=UPI00286F6F0A|nr:uncharacterized protein LOC132195265 [Neocloeon triangulifer]